jgi:hypothetical protein
MPYEATHKLSASYGIGLPDGIIIEDAFWYTSKGASKGGLASIQKQGGVIGNPKIRLAKWHEWWKQTGKHTTRLPINPLPFTKPEKSELLAEFIGIMMGDGGMTSMQLNITLHHVDDLAYSKFVVACIKKLFAVTPSVYHRIECSVNTIVVSRSGLVAYLHELGLPIGNKVKQRFDIPEWIKTNRNYMIACIRGLIDTDGSVFTHRYRVNGKMYAYKKICFSSSSPPLIASVHTFLSKEGFYARISRSGKHIRIESVAGVKRYMQMICPHNPKHLKRYEK